MTNPALCDSCGGDSAALFYFQSLTAVASGANTDYAPALSAKGGEAAT